MDFDDTDPEEDYNYQGGGTLGNAIGDVVDHLLTDELIEKILEYLTAAAIKAEVEQQKTLIEEEHYEAAVLRQATFIESLLQFNIVRELESHKGTEMSVNEKRMVSNLGNKNKVYLANSLGILEDEKEFQAYTTLMGSRSEIAHEWWMMFDEDDQARFERISRRILSKMEQSISEYTE
ncbi:hypothetical protein ACFQJC_17335 [Haloferax namakaokahaiae]|uniref:Uncharacterized protein n=1 Tax=Haloferax namakaokahaiae TaxID=1748331 RepID=A0ABD5ZJ10_9EURY